MDPLTVFVASIVGAMISDAMRSNQRLHHFYPKSARGDIEVGGWTSMDGENVRWWVEPGSAVWIDAKYVRPIDGNIFYPEKLGAIARAVRQNPGEKIPFYAGYGQIKRLELSDIVESIEYAQWQVGEPYTTGNPDLDKWIVAKEEGDTSDYDDEEIEDLEARLTEAIENEEGDIGKWSATVRDGNHRVFGAILGGESRVAIRIYDNDVQEIRDALWGGRLRSQTIPLLKKAITDTQTVPDWYDRIPEEGLLLLKR